MNEQTDTSQIIAQQIQEHPILLYMKGSPERPQCGFSARITEILINYGKRFAYVDVLSNPDIRSELPQYAKWPTFPQLWVNGQLVGGCDIVHNMHETGKLQPLLDTVSVV